ncbi:MAG TPA: MerR family transcriptional regulator [bacterium]
MTIGPGYGVITSAQLAKLTGVSLSTIHYYTALGLLRPRGRAGNRRLYLTYEARNRLKRIAQLRRKGYSLALIRREM